MIAVILLPGRSPRMLGLDAQQSPSLLPLGDRPFLQHLVEFLVAQGITSHEIVMEHAPERVESLLGNGDRWGCRFRYHLIREAERPYRSLRVMSETQKEPWLLIHADRFPLVSFAQSATEKPVLYCIPDAAGVGEGISANGHGAYSPAWGGTALFPAGRWTECLWDKTAEELQQTLGQWLTEAASARLTAMEWMDVSTPEALLETQVRLLRHTSNGNAIGGIERQKGVWISRNVVIHPTAELVAPLYIGPDSRISRNARIGPDTVIAGSCIIDTDTTVEHSLVLPGTYVGTGLELNHSIVNRDRLVNIEIGAGINVAESFLLGALSQEFHENWIARIASILLAALLILLTLPLLLLSVLYFAVIHRCFPTFTRVARVPVIRKSPHGAPSVSVPCLGEDAWRVHRPAGWTAFCRQFLPGLYAVLAGRLALVGLPPKTAEDIERLSPDWRALYEKSYAGLITEASIAAADGDDAAQYYLCDAYYVAKKTWRHDLGVAFAYFRSLFRKPPLPRAEISPAEE